MAVDGKDIIVQSLKGIHFDLDQVMFWVNILAAGLTPCPSTVLWFIGKLKCSEPIPWTHEPIRTSLSLIASQNHLKTKPFGNPTNHPYSPAAVKYNDGPRWYWHVQSLLQVPGEIRWPMRGPRYSGLSQLEVIYLDYAPSFRLILLAGQRGCLSSLDKYGSWKGCDYGQCTNLQLYLVP